MNELIKDIFYLIILFLAVWVSFYLGTRHDTVSQRTARYNCDLAEFVADVPVDVRNECRRLRIQQINKEKE